MSKKQSNDKAKKSNANVRVVFGKEIPKDWRKEIRVLLTAIQAFEGSTGVTFEQVLSKAIELRSNSKFDLKPFNELSKKVQTNFVNRLAKTLGGTVLSAEIKPSAQSKFFNFEIQTGKQIVFANPIDPTTLISPQVKKDNSFDLSRLVVKDLKQPTKKFDKLTKAQEAQKAKLYK